MRPTLDEYQSVPGWCSDIEAAALQAAADGRRVLEIGTWKGRSTIAMAATAESILAVDHFEGDGFAGKSNPSHETLDRFAPYSEVIAVCVADWRIVRELLDPSRFDLIYYDADHTYEATADFLDWAATLGKPLAIHDVDDNPNHAGVKRALVERFPDFQLFDRLAVVECDSPA